MTESPCYPAPMRRAPAPMLLALFAALALPACGAEAPTSEARLEAPEVSLARTLDEAAQLIRKGQPRTFLAQYTPPEALAERNLEARLPAFTRRQTKVQAALNAARIAGPELATDGQTARFHYEGLALEFRRAGARWYIEVL